MAGVRDKHPQLRLVEANDAMIARVLATLPVRNLVTSPLPYCRLRSSTSQITPIPKPIMKPKCRSTLAMMPITSLLLVQ